ncbi:hypothetical protein FOB64_005995 [Candida albicans]|uniref:ATP synthase subunit d, mitochondrial n=1 Tax=Candida albicans TaxID=5476 RepID=A0A8H6BTF2_CANAX|nr:hypothetical protein FOB64_005995 [Candida albicans]
MSSVAKQAARKVDFNKLVNGLGLTGTTASSLTAFKKRHDEAKKEFIDLSTVSGFKPVTIDVSKNLKNIEIFESKAIENAKLTEKSVLEEISVLQKTLKEIESARPFDQLTVDDVAAASDLEEKVTYMVKNGKWEVPGYREKFGDLAAM